MAELDKQVLKSLVRNDVNFFRDISLSDLPTTSRHIADFTELGTEAAEKKLIKPKLIH